MDITVEKLIELSGDSSISDEKIMEYYLSLLPSLPKVPMEHSRLLNVIKTSRIELHDAISGEIIHVFLLRSLESNESDDKVANIYYNATQMFPEKKGDYEALVQKHRPHLDDVIMKKLCGLISNDDFADFCNDLNNPDDKVQSLFVGLALNDLERLPVLLNLMANSRKELHDKLIDMFRQGPAS